MAKKKGIQLSAFSILFLIIFALAILTYLFPQVQDASLATVVMAPFNGFKEAIDVCIFILLLGGFLGVVTKTGALDAGIGALVKKLKGNELVLIVILMILFSIGGTTYGMAEETVAFYVLICSTMVAAGFDTTVGVATIMLGAGVGVLGSTVNPFAVGVALDALKEKGIQYNSATVIVLGAILWLTALLMAIFYVLRYAKKVKAEKGSTILSLQEQNDMHEHFGHANFDNIEFTGKTRATLIVFGITFIIMVISLIPWENFGINIFVGWSSFLTGTPLGQWYFGELSMWFLIAAIVIGVINGFKESEIIDSFMDGVKDILSVVLIIAVARGASVLMAATKFDTFILESASTALKGLSPVIFAPASYVLFLVLSFLIPSTSGLASVAFPVLGPLTSTLGYSAEVMVLIFSAASGVINLITPTSGVVMGGLAIGKMQYGTWLKFVGKLIAAIIIADVVILTAAMMFIR
ncbi:YfcC family protein [Pseudoleptotrichia goodfellowii]|uniref:C4-dicarboxylate anaerobic carrier n=1 Tax=Pseudoleptotrichia goodfellowii F0264 TaxID=596323 RepID=D0GJ95_9FUSO|nr:YfcC family protein [Pseudoleptotrichia goodfellowii]EEY35833.1 C4-dicarboxylate anaerobic carrier [Pseudoleptotrichia goodfellowii F0264]MBF4806129.1 YfcC family protein [Pseudoleptotrichia goodfellowii]